LALDIKQGGSANPLIELLFLWELCSAKAVLSAIWKYYESVMLLFCVCKGTDLAKRKVTQRRIGTGRSVGLAGILACQGRASIARMYIPRACWGFPNPQCRPDGRNNNKPREEDTTEKEEKRHLHIELTQQQYNVLRKNCQKAGLTMREYLARLIMGTPVRARPSGEIRELRVEVHRIGNNINQIARGVNSGQITPELAQKALFLLGKVYEMMYQIAKRG